MRSIPLRGSLVLLTALSLAAPAMADDDLNLDDLDDAGQEDQADQPDRQQDADTEDEADPEDDDDWMVAPDAGEQQLDFEGEFDEDTDVQVMGPGQDTARIYRAYLQEVEDLGPDEEALAWERYFKKYPNTVFRARIDDRLEVLSKEMYDEQIEDRYSRTEDAGRAELNFAQPVMLESADPRSKIRAGFQWGFPNYMALHLDLEHQLQRNLSVHGGIVGRYTGHNLEAGARYALIKSARTNLLVTAIGDFHVNLDPMMPGLRPQLAVGKRVRFNDQVYLDVMAQGGGDFMMVPTSDGGSHLSIRDVGGINISIAPTSNVRAYVETSTVMKGVGDSEVPGAFRFNAFTFGIKFVNRKGASTDRFEAGVGASAPFATNYYGYHFGAIGADVNYYLDQ